MMKAPKEEVNPDIVQASARGAAHEHFRFVDLCKLFEQIANSVDKASKIRLLDQLWIRIAGNEVFPFMRLILPVLDSERSNYGLRESKIARMYIELLGLSYTSPDAERFKHWKDPTKYSTENTHFSDVVYVVLTKRAHVSTASLTVADVNDHLTRLADAALPDHKKQILMTLLRSMSALEQKWLIRVITKEMKMHLQHGSVLGAFHPLAAELYNNTTDLKYVCQKCSDPAELAAINDGDVKDGIFLLRPLKPMLSSIVDSAKLNMLLANERLLVEPKFDGERMMLHVNVPSVMYWTRNGKNFTAQYGPKYDPIILGQLRGVRNCILDGEFMLYDGLNGRFKEFGQNRTFAASGVDSSGIDNVKEWFCYCVFDVVFLNGESLVNRPLSARKEILRSILEPIQTKCEIVNATHAPNLKAILTSLDEAMADGFEGIVIKISNSVYVPGERKLKWLKLKPDHIVGMADTVDLIILGGYYGTKFGKRHISHFLLGAHKNSDGSSPKSPDAMFSTVCKVGTGYSEQELNELNSRLESKWLTFSSVPQWLDGWRPSADDLPDLWILPMDSVVMEVLGYSFTVTSKFNFGRTIRFPRCYRMRYDKDIDDATNVELLSDIVAKSAASNCVHKAGDMDELIMIRKRRRDTHKDEHDKEQRSFPVRNFAVVDDRIALERHPPRTVLFCHYEACVLFADPDIISRSALERLLQEHGAIVVSNPSRVTSLLVATSKNNIKVRNWIGEASENEEVMFKRYGTLDIVSFEWVRECIESNSVLPLAPRHMIFSSTALKMRFSLALDNFEDSFFQNATVSSLKTSIALACRFISPPSTLQEAFHRLQKAKNALV